MGENGVRAILQIAHIEKWIADYPPDDMNRAIDFAHYSAVQGALEEMYGPRSSPGIARRAGWETFDKLIRHRKRFSGTRRLLTRVLPFSMMMRYGLRALASEFARISDQETSIEERTESFQYVIHRCPHCWGRQSSSPTCHLTTGMLEECLRWATRGDNFLIREIECIAMGDKVCRFHVDKSPLSV
jgi:bacteriochlorophyll 4-vinyl reductase